MKRHRLILSAAISCALLAACDRLPEPETNPIDDRGSISAPADFRITLDGNQEGISIGTVIGSDRSSTITAVPYISKNATVNPVSFEGDASCSQDLNETSGVRTILIQDIKSNVTVTFNGVTL